MFLITVDYRLKLLYSFRFSLKDMIMFLVGQTDQVLRTVIGFDSIKMVDDPLIRQQYAMELLPYYNVFKYIPTIICPRMLWRLNKHVSILMDGSTTSPSWMILSTLRIFITCSAHCSLWTNWIPAYIAWVVMFFPLPLPQLFICYHSLIITQQIKYVQL